MWRLKQAFYYKQHFEDQYKGCESINIYRAKYEGENENNVSYFVNVDFRIVLDFY